MSQKEIGKVYVKLSRVYLLNIGYWKLYRQLSKETGTPIASLPHVDGSAEFCHYPIFGTSSLTQPMMP